jgi:hypothetical protein
LISLSLQIAPFDFMMSFEHAEKKKCIRRSKYFSNIIFPKKWLNALRIYSHVHMYVELNSR